jgi:hypothetical protein
MTVESRKPDAVLERLLHTTASLCRVCKNGVPARVVALPDQSVWMTKKCKDHGPQSVQLSTDAVWYEATRKIAPVTRRPRKVVRRIEHGCPFDCGSCEAHEQKVRLPVVTITSACNLDCPICYVHNKNEGAFHMGVDEFKQILAHLVEDAGDGDPLDIINFTGGEPTLHPHLFDILEAAKASGVHRLTVCSNGIRLAKDEGFVKRLAALGARIALSFDTFEPEADVLLQGVPMLATKLKALDMLEKHGVDCTLIPVMTKGVNDHEVGKLIELSLQYTCIRHVEIHTMTYTGQGGVSFDRKGRIGMTEVLDRIAETTGGWLQRKDFVPTPAAHPLCYQIVYLLLDPAGGRPVPFTRFLSRETIYDCMADRLYLEPSRKLEDALRDAIDRLWADGREEDERTLGLLRHMLAEMFPLGRKLSAAEALKTSERFSKAIYIHSHMDEETFDVERIVQCCDSNCYADGTTIPVCSYNILYREKEARFMKHTATWNERSGGVKLPVVNPMGDKP